ncbi:hypothetical protein KIH74_05250 [Kineosporia sp. J2-2]|uniref:histidine kinase n=1 Tax=Kineosporia corallincola TaxID=2835133 RepID=A0ABS5TB64_9ACTN|nr:histidine kinase [Kineosporia corallincola]MBT0768318.1 hypothetical protein [Kineosporia corallincola]
MPALIVLFTVGVVLDSTDRGPLRWCGLLAGSAAGMSLYRRHRNPERVLVLNLLLGAVSQVIAPEALFPYAALVALWTLTARRPVVRSLPALAGVMGLTLLVLPSHVHVRANVEFAVVVAATVWALAFALRSHRLMIEQAAARSAVEEQSRLARDVHDVIAHGVSVIVVQAAAADDVFDTHPDRARQALRSIEATGRDALTELRTLLSRDNRLKSEADAANTTPQPTLERLGPDVIGPLEAAGLRVAVQVQGDPSSLPPGVQLSAFRIIQESLTNVLRHGAGAPARVRVTVGERGLELLVDNVWVRDGVVDGAVEGESVGGATVDAGRAGAGSVPGRGIAGMRERAALVGGVLEAGPVEAGPGWPGGFRVSARLPVRGRV